MDNYAHFSKDPSWWKSLLNLHEGLMTSAPLVKFPSGTGASARALSPLPHMGMGRPGEAPTWYGISFNSTRQGGGGEMAFRLVAVWMHPYQACYSSLDEVARKPALLIDLGDNWAYAFVQLNKNAQHIPLSDEGHLSAMIDGMPSKSACRHLCQLEVCKLLPYGDQVVYPEGLNGGLELIKTSSSGPLLCGQDVLGDYTPEPSFLLVDLPQATSGDHMPEAPAPLQNLNTVCPFPPHLGTPP